MRKRSILIVLWLVSLWVTDALRDCWSCERAGYWAWHLVKWWFFYGTLCYILWKRWPLWRRGRWEGINEWTIIWRNIIVWVILGVLSAVVWTVTARTWGNQPQWGGIGGIF